MCPNLPDVPIYPTLPYTFLCFSVKIRYLALTEDMKDVGNKVNVTLDIIVSIVYIENTR